MSELLWNPRFDDLAFARKLAPAVQEAGGVRKVAEAARVSPATVSRACTGWPQLSYENYLRLTAWLDETGAGA